MPILHDWSCKIKCNKNVEKAKSNGFRPFINVPGDGLYIGEWKNNKPDHNGKKIFKNGLIYDGQWKNGRMHGQGTLRKLRRDGSEVRIYIGGWKNNKKHGEGKKYYENGIYFGFWECNERNGYGIMWYNNGSTYLGEWKNDLYDGVGVLFESKGNRYEGYFARGLKHGEGLYYHIETGQVQKGIWKDGLCKSSMVIDLFRNSVTKPTLYALPPIRLANPQDVVFDCFSEYYSDERKKANILEAPKVNILSRIRKKLETYSAF